jgi:beta-lactamase superfamily II metal-dependent hydrolase
MADSTFTIELLPAKQGDAIWVKYSKGEMIRRILIDGGPIKAYPELEKKLKAELKPGNKRVELIVITHVDTDHIEGIIRLLMDEPDQWLVAPKEIWFNGWKHIRQAKILGGVEGDYISALINNRAPDKWNKAFNEKPVMVNQAMADTPVVLEDGMKITILSPDAEKLRRMEIKWKQDVAKKKLEPGDVENAWKLLLEDRQYQPKPGVLGAPGEIDELLIRQLKIDPSKANGTSIAFLASFEGKSCLFLGDAHADIVARSVEKLIPAGQKRLKVDVVKVSHHGSRANISKKLMNLLDARHYLLSTNGGGGYNHPDDPAIEVIIQGSLRTPELWFNYRPELACSWEKAPLEGQRNFTVHFPEPGSEGISIDLMKL